MKLFLKKIFGIGFLVMFVLGFSACGEDTKSYNTRLNANNGFYTDEDSLYWIKDGKILSLDLEEGEIDDEWGEISKDLDKKKKLGLASAFEVFVKDGNELKMCDPETAEYDSLFDFILPEQYSSIINLGGSVVFQQNKKTISVYAFGKEVKTFDFDKDYDSAFYLGDSLNMVGLIKGKEIDLISVNGIVAPDYKPIIKKHFELDKQYDAYVGCTVDYQEMFWEKTAYIGCIEGNKIKFYDIKKGQFAKIPLTGEEMSWTF